MLSVIAIAAAIVAFYFIFVRNENQAWDAVKKGAFGDFTTDVIVHIFMTGSIAIDKTRKRIGFIGAEFPVYSHDGNVDTVVTRNFCYSFDEIDRVVITYPPSQDLCKKHIFDVIVSFKSDEKGTKRYDYRFAIHSKSDALRLKEALTGLDVKSSV